ncbi:unnamed protein product [Staurois parvus]|uniref:Transmembrane protein n=1 Tax=Staurois parvus TaxID=386267 RepID=A0ABN9FS23_9NEOB|nr:unnamed protein product [Staurois parvus]
MGRMAALFTNSPSPCRLRHSTALQSRVLTVKHQHPPVKHSQYTVNPLIDPHVNPFLPSAFSILSVLFFLALITVLVSLGMSVTPSQFPPV